MKTAFSLEAGDKLPPLSVGPVTRLDLALFAGASGDHNALHIDLDAARAAGMPDVFAQGMLPMAYLGRCLTGWFPQRQLRSWGVRFMAMTHLQDVLTCTGEVAELIEMDGERCARLALSVVNQADVVKLSGDAVVRLAARSSA